MVPDCLGTLSSTLCQISALKKAIGSYVYDNTIFLKWGILNVPFCLIFIPFHFYLIMTLVVPCLVIHNMFMVLLIFALGNIKIGVTKPIFLDSGCPRGEGGLCVCGHGLLSLYSSYILNSSKKIYFLCLFSDLCRAMLPNYLRTYSSALC